MKPCRKILVTGTFIKWDFLVSDMGSPLTIRYQGLFDLEGLYKTMGDWFMRYRFEVHEKNMKHKLPPASKGAEQEMQWIATQRATEYIELKYTLNIHIWDLQEVEIEEHGRKKMLANCRIQIVIDQDIVTDWQGMSSRNRFAGVLHKIYHKLKFREIGDWDDIVLFRQMDLMSKIKKFFGMQTKYQAYSGMLGENR